MTKNSILSLMLILVAVSALATPRHLIIPRQGVGLNAIERSYELNVVGRYANALWVEGSVEAVRASDAFIKSYPDWDLIRTVQPFRIGDRPTLRSMAESGLYLVHYPGPMKPEWSSAIRSLPGLTVVQSFPRFAVIVHVAGTPVDFNRLAGVDWAGPLKPQWRISTHLLKAAPETEGKAEIMMVNAPGLQKTFDRLRELGVQFSEPKTSTNPWFILRATGSRSMVDQVAALEHVLWIEPALEYELFDERQGMAQAGLITGWVPDTAGYKSWLTANGLDNLSTVIVDVADDGWDTGDLTVGNHHPDFDDAVGTTNRILSTIDLCGDGQHGVGGHGTINQSIVLGDGAGTAVVDGDGYSYGTGIAPTARGSHTKIFNDDGTFCPTVYSDITTGAQAGGAHISSNSWGASGAYGGYTASSAEYDLLVRDANNNSADGLQEFTIVFSAGNDGPVETSTGAPGTAKNVITSGASENVRDDGVPDGCSSGPADDSADSFRDVTNFSSPGPCTDGRIKPDAMGPGTHVQGAASQYSGFDGSSVCGGVGDPYYPPGQTWYTWSAGTSHSAPAMAGTAALIYEWYLGETGSAPSPAMNKAIMLGAATDMAGGDDGNGSILANFPNSRQGWGLINMGRVVDDASYYVFDQEHVFTASAQDFTPVPIFEVVDPTTPVRIMMVYSDAPGDPNASPSGQLANDLDLEVMVGGNVYWGNNFTAGFSVTGGSPDGVNNVEAVYFPAGTVNTFSVRVIASNIAADAIPGDGNLTDQDFALYMYNVTDQSSNGVIFLSKSAFNCSASLTISVSDEDLQNAGTQNVTIKSSTETTPETLSLTEAPAGSGVFQGSIALTSAAASAGDGLLSVADGDTITATYEDADVGGVGGAVTKTTTADVDCVGPVITLIDVPSPTLTEDSAVVTWMTNEPATSVVDYDTGAPLGQTVAMAGAHTAHSVALDSLDSCTSYLYQVTSCDPWGNCTTDSNASSYYSFFTGTQKAFFGDDVEGGTSFWIAEPPWAITDEDSNSSSHSWTDSPGGQYENDLNISLTSPMIDLTSAAHAELIFYHHYELETDYDYAFVEASTNGSNWDTVLTFNGTEAVWTQVTADLGSYVGNANVQLRFRITTDGSSLRDGWHIDDVKVVTAIHCSEGVVALDRMVYVCADTVNIEVADIDLNANPALTETVAVELSSNTETNPEVVILTEDGLDSTRFLGSINLSDGAAAADGVLSVVDGNTIVAEYADADNGSGIPATASDSATIDCEAPVISDMQIVDITSNSAQVTWLTNEVANSILSWEALFEPDLGSVEDAAMVTDHSLKMNDLLPCTIYGVVAQSMDPLGFMQSSSTKSFNTSSGAFLDSVDTPVSIPDNLPVGASSTISMAAIDTVVDLNVLINVTHTYDGDLDISLIGPDATTVELSTKNGGFGDNYVNTVFDDEAATAVVNGSAPFTGSFIPEQALSAFDGKTTAGDWVLHIVDDAGGDIGEIVNWQLQISTPCDRPVEIFQDGFEGGTTDMWSSTWPIP